MSFPDGWTTIQVSATYVNHDGSIPNGFVIFKSPQITTGQSTIVLPSEIVAKLDANGSFSVLLQATNDPNFTPMNWAWIAEERLGGITTRRFSFPVDAGGGPIDLGTIAPVVPPPITTGQYPYQLRIGTVSTLTPGTPASANIRGDIPNQILDLGIPTEVPSITFTAIANGDINGGSVVAINNGGRCYNPDLTNITDVTSIIGIAVNSGHAEDTINVQNTGQLSEVGWGWNQGPIYCSLTGGQLTQSAPDTGAVVQMAIASNTTTIQINIRQPILRS